VSAGRPADTAHLDSMVSVDNSICGELFEELL